MTPTGGSKRRLAQRGHVREVDRPLPWKLGRMQRPACAPWQGDTRDPKMLRKVKLQDSLGGWVALIREKHFAGM